MSPSELFQYREARLFIGLVLRDIPVHYRFKIDIQDELCDHLLCSVEDFMKSAAEPKAAVKKAVSAMGKPAVLAKYYREAYKGREGYKTQLFLMWLRRWGGLFAWLVLFFLFGYTEFGYTHRLFFAVPSVIVSYFCARNLCKWQNALINMFAPAFLLIPTLLLSWGIDYASTTPLGEYLLASLGTMLRFALCWIMPCALVFAFVAARERLPQKSGMLVQLGLVSACCVLLVFFAYKADFSGRLSQEGYSRALDRLEHEITLYVDGGMSEPEQMLDAAADVDLYALEITSTLLISKYSVIAETDYTVMLEDEQYSVRGVSAYNILNTFSKWETGGSDGGRYILRTPEPDETVPLGSDEAKEQISTALLTICRLIDSDSGKLASSPALVYNIYQLSMEYSIEQIG